MNFCNYISTSGPKPPMYGPEVTGECIRDKIAASKRKSMWMGGVPLGHDLELARKRYTALMRVSNDQQLLADQAGPTVAASSSPTSDRIRSTSAAPTGRRVSGQWWMSSASASSIARVLPAARTQGFGFTA